jgi:predicted DsbA family dithiol-disulfide isomerase
MDMMERYTSLNKAGEPFGIRFGERTFLSNSRPSLEASEYARDKGRYDSFHERIFRAYFADLLDIGDEAILCSLAQEEGLDPGELSQCLRDGIYSARIEEAMREATLYGITAVPTFIINETHKIVGAQPLGSFRDRLASIQGECTTC